MSDDLISRKAFMEYLGLEDTEENRKENVGEIATLEDFDRQPTAFDKEKVMEKLQEAADLSVEDGLWHVELQKAFEIIKKGGIE